MPQKSVTGQLQSRVQQVAQGVKQAVAAARRPWYLAIRCGFVLLTLFGLLALWVHVHPVLPLDITITREFQENQAPWLRYTMLAVSYPGSSLPVSIGLVVLAAVVFWVLHLRLEAVMVVALPALLVVLVGPSRIYLGDHWASDVLGAYLGPLS